MKKAEKEPKHIRTFKAGIVLRGQNGKDFASWFNLSERTARVIRNHLIFRVCKSEDWSNNWIRSREAYHKGEKYKGRIDKNLTDFMAPEGTGREFTKIRSGEVIIKDRDGKPIELKEDLQKLPFAPMRASSAQVFSLGYKKIFEKGKGCKLKDPIPVSKKNPKPRKRSHKNPFDLKNFPKPLRFRKGEKASIIFPYGSFKVDFEGRRLYLSKFGWVPLSFYEMNPAIPPESVPRSCTLRMVGDRHIVTIACEVPEIIEPHKDNPIAAIDVNAGGRIAVAADNGFCDIFEIRVGKSLKKKELKIQKFFSNQSLKPGSRKYKKLLKRFRSVCADQSNQRDHDIKIFCSAFRDMFSGFICEDLKIRQMTKSAKGTDESPGKNVRQKSGLNRDFLKTAPAKIIESLERKGVPCYAKVDARYTSQRCHACAHVDKKNRSGERFKCVKCGHKDHADLNAAWNILERGLFGFKVGVPSRGGEAPR